MEKIESPEEIKNRAKEMKRMAERRKKQGVQTKSFGNHQPFYHYRLHVPRLQKSCTGALKPFGAYLGSIFDAYPPLLFDSPTSLRCSTVSFDFPFTITRGTSEHLSTLTRDALEQSPYKAGHDKVQLHFLDNDESILTTETPVWATDRERDLLGIINAKTTIRQNHPAFTALTGHIDLVQIKDGNVWILDYKPITSWSQSEYPECQTYLYALLLSIRSGLPLDTFRCGWFNDKDFNYFIPRTLDPDLIERFYTLKNFHGQE